MNESKENLPNEQWHEQNQHKKVSEKILIVFWLNLSFSIFEMIGGVIAGSFAIIADAIHDFGDSLALGFAWYLEKISCRKKDNVFSYGYARFSLLSAIVCALIILLGMGYVLIEAVFGFFQESERIPHAGGMIFLAVIGVLVNGYAALKLSHGHTHNEKILTWHMLEDLFNWIAVLVGAILIMLFDWYFIDGLLAIAIALYVGYNALKHLKQSLKIILQSVPDEFNLDNILNEIKKIEGVIKAHDLHIWSLDGSKNILSVHVVVSRDENADGIKRIVAGIRENIADFGEFHSTIEIEQI